VVRCVHCDNIDARLSQCTHLTTRLLDTTNITGLEIKGSVKAVRTPEDGRKHARNMVRFY
jgi:hypothetical protein